MMPFSIDFIPEFSDHDGNRHRIGLLRVGDDSNRFEAPLDYWTEDDYRRQWAAGLERALAGRPSCLLTWMYDPTARYYAQWWELVPRASQVVISETMLDLSDIEEEFSVDTAYALADDEAGDNGDAAEDIQPSRWYIDRKDVQAFYDSEASSWA